MINPFQPGYYFSDELRQMGFYSIGDNVQIAKNTTIVGLENISIGNNVRIDGFSTIVASGANKLIIGSWIHIGGYCFLAAGGGLEFEDFAGLSQGVRIYTRSDDYSGKYMTNPTVPSQYTNVVEGVVKLKMHSIIGSGTVILPGVTIGEGAAVGALSLVTKSLEDWKIYLGTPAKPLKNRSKRLIELEAELKGVQLCDLK